MSDDLFLVCNILTDDEHSDPSGYSYADYFEVKWDGVQTRIKPGETALLPEYLADHFASHLIDYLLTRDKKMIHDESLREPLMRQIVIRRALSSDKPGSKEEVIQERQEELSTSDLDRRTREITQKETELTKESDRTKMMRQEVEKQSSRLNELINSYEKREKLVKDREKELRIREIKLADKEIVA